MFHALLSIPATHHAAVAAAADNSLPRRSAQQRDAQQAEELVQRTGIRTYLLQHLRQAQLSQLDRPPRQVKVWAVRLD